MISRHGTALIIDADGARFIGRLIRTATAAARRNGIPAPSELSELQAHVDAVIAAERTLNRHRAEYDREEWITAQRYAELTGCTERTARRHAAERGRKLRGRWFLPIER